MSRVAFCVRDLVVDYEVFSERRAGLRQRLVTGKGSGRRLVHAVRGISFDVREGESVGVIGSNGSGKSTMLRTLAGLLEPTSGSVLVRSEPHLFGVGAILMPRATGIENIRLGCLAQGMTAGELTARIDQIVEFAGIGEAIDRPINTYSSGMRARLHFAISVATSPEILLIDEALSVGDKAFKEQSRERIEQIIERAGTVVLVSHSMQQIESMCARVIWLEKGVIRMDGAASDVIAVYEESKQDTSTS